MIIQQEQLPGLVELCKACTDAINAHITTERHKRRLLAQVACMTNHVTGTRRSHRHNRRFDTPANPRVSWLFQLLRDVYHGHSDALTAVSAFMSATLVLTWSDQPMYKQRGTPSPNVCEAIETELTEIGVRGTWKAMMQTGHKIELTNTDALITLRLDVVHFDRNIRKHTTKKLSRRMALAAVREKLQQADALHAQARKLEADAARIKRRMSA